MSFAFATCDRRNALRFLQKLHPSMVIADDVTRANARGEALQKSGPTAESARYDRRIGRVVVRLSTGLDVAFSPHDAQGLEAAKPADLARIEISPSGLGLHFPKLDADLYLPALLEGFLGSKRWTLRSMLILDVELPADAQLDTLMQTWEAQLVDEEVPAVVDMLQTLLADNARFLDSAAVGRAITGNPDHAHPKMAATRARQAGRIFGVWDGNAYRYPAFQFDDAGQPRDDVQDLIALLPRDGDGSGRAAALWLFAPDAAFGGDSPASAFLTDPHRVIAVARRRRGDDPNSD